MTMLDIHAEFTTPEALDKAREAGQRSHATVAATHEPAPTGEGAVIIDIAVGRAKQKAQLALGRGNPTGHDAFKRVAAALTARAEMGKAKYGTYLRANNGRNALVDLYQEILDAIMYSEQCYREQNERLCVSELDEPTPKHLIVGAEQLGDLYEIAARIAPFVEAA